MKSKVISLVSWFNRNIRSIIIWIFLVALFTLLEARVSSLILKYNLIGESEITSRYFNLIFKAIKIIGTLLFSFLFIKNYRLSKHLNFWILFIAVTYYVLKSNQTDKLELISIPNDIEGEKDFYADIFLYLGYLTIILFIRNLFDDFKFYDSLKTTISKWLLFERKEQESIYKEDIPIGGSAIIDNDIVVSTLVSQIDDLYPTNAFVIGINGEWGNGKTTFLKRLEYKLKFDVLNSKKAPIIFWFNAWQHQDEKSIVNNFFNQLKKELGNYSGDAKASINKYLSRLLALFDGKYSKGVTLLSEDFLKNQLTIKGYYKNIDDLISRIDRKIIVFVDDLDRLNKTEIVEVVRILRNVANFKNTLFICGFDKTYVIKTGGFENNFLDKIFNLEINLPKLNQNGLLIFFDKIISSSKAIQNKDRITKTFSSLFDTDTDASLFDISIDDVVGSDTQQKIEIPKFSSIPLNPSLFFETRRDVKRFYNSLVTDLNILGNINDVELEDYLLFKLLVFRYSWIFSQFDNRRINLWLGSSNSLKLDEDKLDFLEKKQELELIDKSTIYSVLEKLFPNNSMEDYKEGSRRINQRRYLPIYLNNNVFNQSFSYTNLISAHKELKIAKLIEDKVIGRANENYLLNDIKSFILREENLNNINEYKQVVKIIHDYLGGKVSDFELTQLIHVGEKLEGFKELADNKIFINIDDVFGQFLRLLNMCYTRIPNDISMGRNDIGSYLSRYKLKELSIVGSNYVESKLVELYKKYLEGNRTIVDASRMLFDCIETYYHYFGFYLFYDEANGLFKNYLRKNFKLIFLNSSPKESLKLISGDSMASIFVSSQSKKDIKNEASKLIEERNQWTKSDLDVKSFLKEGWGNFLIFFEKTYKESNLSEEERGKAETFYAFVYTYIKKGFVIPTKNEVLIDEILKKMREKDKKNKQDNEGKT